MVTLTVTYTFADGREVEAERLLRELIAATRTEPGCKRYEVFRSSETPRTFLIFEQYADEAALEAHRGSEHFERLGLNGIRMIAEHREAKLYADFV
jgi:quinol monooxygenase YgiN